MIGFTELRPGAKAYLIAVVLAGVAAVVQSAQTLYATPLEPQWLILAGLTLLTGSFTIKVPSINARISVSETFVFASVLLFGAASGTITVLLEALIILLWMAPAGRPPHRLLFNMAAPTIAIWVSGNVFFLVSGIEPFSAHTTPLQGLFIPLAAFTALYFLLNSWLVAIAVGLETRTSPYSIWVNNFIWLSVNYFSGASVAALIVTYTRRLDIGTLAVIVPLLVISYLTFKTAMGRVEDSNQHLTELNRLHLSTIETLAMAIDAKDQVTHGHIRRVQTYAIGLARHLGVIDQRLIKAIEAAALLHDMGKLAVPEYILNKPGKLTPAEFEKMKIHASVGADILSAIAFPYPVVPIVRHHHENWNGTGYPDGLRGTQIPIGARILSVVDCFDALTSDRPYRPRLGDTDALAILLDRRGSMYDPMVVDSFLKVHNSLAPEPAVSEPQRYALREIATSTQAIASPTESPRHDEITASGEEMLTLYELAQALAGPIDFGEAGDAIAKHLRRLVPSSLCVFFLYDPGTDELEARHAVGDGAASTTGMRIPLGQRLSGWVGANRQTIMNSDPSLDFGEGARTHALNLRSCLSTPLLGDGQLVGVLSMYSRQQNGFNEDHKRILEVVARQIAHTFHRAIEVDATPRRDTVTGLPTLRNDEQLGRVGGVERPTSSGEFTMLFIDMVGLSQINTVHGWRTGDEALRHVARHAASGLRLADILFRNGGSEFVALLADTGPEEAKAISTRINESVVKAPLVLRGERTITVEICICSASAPQDGESISDLLVAARRRRRPGQPDPDESTIH